MSYTVLARRYRSTTFAEVIGQEAVATTLRNAIASGRVAHAYLFTGTRGVGKTSTARLFARALNAPDTIDDAPKPDDGYDYPPLDIQQRMAAAIMRGEDLDVIEIDGASNASVDEARQLIANAGLAPTGNARYKVYIIDEVHQLSRHAFNALLKTMEEPPPHVKFILCTTESHKVPTTIQSRCQRFDFRAIPVARIADHLRSVVAREGMTADEAVILHVARLGNGSMRDALTVLERLLAAADPQSKSLTVELLETTLGLPPSELIRQLVDALAAGEPADALRATAALLDRGIAPDLLLESLIDRLRQLMILTSCGRESDLVELTEQTLEQAVAQAAKFDTVGLVHLIALCESVGRSIKSAAHPRALLDAAVVRMALSEQLADVAALLAGRAVSSPPEKKKLLP